MVKAINLVRGSNTHKIYTLILQKRAVTAKEILETLPEVKKSHVNSYLRELSEKQQLVLKSRKRVQSKVRKCSSYFVYGISQEDINSKIHTLESRVDEKKLLEGIRKDIFDIIMNSPKGLTLSEVIYELRIIRNQKDYEGWDYVGNCIRDFVLNNMIIRSKFTIPANEMINGRRPGYVYGRDEKAIFDKIIDLMPKEIKRAFFDITQSNQIFPVDVLYNKFGIGDDKMKSWFTYRMVTMGWVKTYSYKQRIYYYNPMVSEDYVASRVPKIHEKEVTDAILENSTLGIAFEVQAIFYYVMYLILCRGRQIRLNKDFPKKIPSWFNRDDIRNPEYVEQDENGEPTSKLKVDVWTFDAEPFDYCIFTYDPVLQSPAESYIVSVKQDKNRKYLGTAGKKYIASIFGCLSLGCSYDCKQLPKRTFLPVMIVNNVNTDKIFKWANKIGCEIFYKSRFEKLKEFVNNMGVVYSDDKVLEEISTEFKLMERYRNHEDVILGRATPEQLVRMRGKNGL